MELLASVIAALVGALAGYGFASIQMARQLKARRRALLWLLRSELERIGDVMQPYDAAKTLHQDSIGLASIAYLLDGQVLSFPRDANIATH